MLYLEDGSSRVFTRLTSSFPLLARPSTLSVRWFVNLWPLMLTVPWCSSKMSLVKLPRKMWVLGTEDNLVWNHFPMEPWNITALLALSHSYRIVWINCFSCYIYSLLVIMLHAALCQRCLWSLWMHGKGFVGRVCFSHRIPGLNIFSVVCLQCWNLTCSSTMISSVWGISLFRIIFNITRVTNQTDSPVVF